MVHDAPFRLELRRSSHKTLARFLKAVTKQGAVKTKVLNSGVTTIMSVHRKHPELAQLVVTDALR